MTESTDRHFLVQNLVHRSLCCCYSKRVFSNSVNEQTTHTANCAPPLRLVLYSTILNEQNSDMWAKSMQNGYQIIFCARSLDAFSIHVQYTTTFSHSLEKYSALIYFVRPMSNKNNIWRHTPRGTTQLDNDNPKSSSSGYSATVAIVIIILGGVLISLASRFQTPVLHCSTTRRRHCGCTNIIHTQAMRTFAQIRLPQATNSDKQTVIEGVRELCNLASQFSLHHT